MDREGAYRRRFKLAQIVAGVEERPAQGERDDGSSLVVVVPLIRRLANDP
ncbi:MAG: hypothetical protein ACR2Q4_03360 [Geminicoccaceae bacterium]